MTSIAYSPVLKTAVVSNAGKAALHRIIETVEIINKLNTYNYFTTYSSLSGATGVCGVERDAPGRYVYFSRRDSTTAVVTTSTAIDFGTTSVCTEAKLMFDGTTFILAVKYYETSNPTAQRLYILTSTTGAAGSWTGRINNSISLLGTINIVTNGAGTTVITFRDNSYGAYQDYFYSVAHGLNWANGGVTLPAAPKGVLLYDAHSSKFLWYSAGHVSRTSDLATWVNTALTVPIAYTMAQVLWVNKYSKYYVSTSSGLYTTTDLLAFTNIASAGSSSKGVIDMPKNMIISYTALATYVSMDGSTFATITTSGAPLAGVFDIASGKCILSTITTVPAIPMTTAITDAVAGVAVAVTARGWIEVRYSVAAGKFMMVALATDKFITSADSLTWTERTFPVSADWSNVVSTENAGAKAFIATARNSTASAVMNGTTYAVSAGGALSAANDWRGMAYDTAGDVALVVASGSTVANKTTNDATAWTSFNMIASLTLQQYGTRIRWSLSSDPRNFTNPLNYIDLPEQNSEIVKLLSDGQRLVAYLETSIYYAVATGDSMLPFTFMKLETGGVGLMSQLGVCRVAGALIFVGRSNVYLFNNLQITAIGDPIVDTTIRKLTNSKMTQCYYNEVRNIVVFGFAVDSATTLDQVWQLNINTKAWSCLATGLSLQVLNGYTMAVPEPFLQRTFTVTADTAYIERRQTDDSDTTVFLETGDLDFGDSDQVKEFFRLKFNIDENEFGATRTLSIVFDVWYSTDFGKSFKKLDSTLIIPVGQQEGYVNFRAMSNYIRFKFSSTSNVAPYAITGYTIDMKMMNPSQTLKLSGGQL